MFQEHSQVVLNCPVPALGLEPGDIGVVVHAHPGGLAYEVEFLSLDDRTVGVKTLKADQPRHVAAIAVPRERLLATA